MNLFLKKIKNIFTRNFLKLGTLQFPPEKQEIFSERLFLFFELGKFPPETFILRANKFYFQKYKQSFFRENIRKFLIFGIESSIFQKIYIYFLEKFKLF